MYENANDLKTVLANWIMNSETFNEWVEQHYKTLNKCEFMDDILELYINDDLLSVYEAIAAKG